MLKISMLSKNSEPPKTAHDDKRLVWERPTLRRLAANYAEQNFGGSNDGICSAGGTGEQKSCKVA
jgi:hypothetical protein